MTVVHNWTESARGDLTIGQLAEQAAESIRALNHLTIAGRAIADPAEACEVVGSLARAAGRLPQLLGQLSRWLVSENRMARLRLDGSSPTTDVGQAVTAAVIDLTEAAEAALRACRALDASHQVLAHLAAASDMWDDPVKDADHDSATRARQAAGRNTCPE